MEQQRKRRYKSTFLSKLQIDNKIKNVLFNTNNITPGTQFMDKLSNCMEIYFQNSNDMRNKYKVNKIIVSSANEHGEGEHKMYSHIRKNKTELKNDVIAVYGLDSDLIMLSIFHIQYCKNIYIFREAPEFLKSSIPKEVLSKNNEPHFLDISYLSISILNEMACRFSNENRIYDYIFLCFFLGNDFLPHFPAMNIRTHGIQTILDLYRLHIGNYENRSFVSKIDGKIQWKYVKIFVNELAKIEHEHLLNEYFVRDKMEKRYYPEKTEVEKQEIVNNIPVLYREEEKYICPSDKFWEYRYYKILFFHMKDKEKNEQINEIKKICLNYLEGLEWVFKYYTEECKDWHWKYNYHYGPLFKDLVKYIGNNDIELIQKNNNEPFTKKMQLDYIMPKETEENEIKLKWSYCRYLWESHIL
jgi:5'-3' exonuclease